MVLAAAELAQVRTDLNASFPTTCYVVRITKVNTEGGWTETPAIVATVACRKAPVSAQERIAGGRIAGEATYVLTMPALTDCRQEDEVTVDTETFAVTEVRKRSPADELVRRVFCREVG